MRGQILVFNEQKEAGAIVTDDGRRFLFHINEWEDVVPPDRGMAVSFIFVSRSKTKLSAWRVAAAVNPAFNLLANCQGRLLHQFASIA